ncbi:MAG: hypothetical protein CMD83_19280 [Gammaproteobacteria bacterium]|nr:hypothetical protein [Gammaproteobacteria bacterium]
MFRGQGRCVGRPKKPRKRGTPMPDAEQVKFVLRLPPSLHKKIKRRARQNNTSMNKEITNILNESFSSQSVEKTLNELVVRLEKRKVI